MQHLDVTKTEAAWSSLAGKVYVPHSEEEYHRLVALLDSFIDEVGEDESHPLASLMEVLGVLIEKYEDEHVTELGDLDRNKQREWATPRFAYLAPSNCGLEKFCHLVSSLVDPEIVTELSRQQLFSFST